MILDFGLVDMVPAGGADQWVDDRTTAAEVPTIPLFLVDLSQEEWALGYPWYQPLLGLCDRMLEEPIT